MADWFLDLEVDVNGEEIFMVNKKVLSSYSGRISRVIHKPKIVSARCLKVIFHDFPGGAANFEVIARFCYNKGRIDNIDPYNISPLTCAAHFMEMNESILGSENLCEKTAKSLQEIKYWTWSELLFVLKQCQDLFPGSNSASIVKMCLDSLVGRVASSCEVSPCPSVSSLDSSGIRLSCDTRSTESSKNSSSFRTTWWFEDLVALNTSIIQELVKTMVSRSFDHGIIARFLFCYQRARFLSALADEKIKIIEMVVDMLDCLDASSVSYKNLFQLLRVGLKLKLSVSCRDKMERMIGLQLDQATLDNLLVPCPRKTSSLYEVNLVLRLVKSFLSKGVCCVPLSRLKKVSSLMDLYLVEVAPDPCLKPSKFLALIKALPESSRDSYDGVYNAINLYLEVHASSLSVEDKMKVCSGLKYEKLSSEALNHLAQNVNIPSKSSLQALICQQRKLKSLLNAATDRTEDDGSKQIVVYAKKMSVSNENEMLTMHLQGMQWRVVELEKVCRKMQIQMAEMMKPPSRSSSSSSSSSSSFSKSVPKLCS